MRCAARPHRKRQAGRARRAARTSSMVMTGCPDDFPSSPAGLTRGSMGCDQIAVRENDMARKTRRWDAAETLKAKEDVAAYLDAVREDGDPDLLKAALGDIARAKGITEITEAAGLGRTNLYKALSPDGIPNSRP